MPSVTVNETEIYGVSGAALPVGYKRLGFRMPAVGESYLSAGSSPKVLTCDASDQGPYGPRVVVRKVTVTDVYKECPLLPPPSYELAPEDTDGAFRIPVLGEWYLNPCSPGRVIECVYLLDEPRLCVRKWGETRVRKALVKASPEITLETKVRIRTAGGRYFRSPWSGTVPEQSMAHVYTLRAAVIAYKEASIGALVFEVVD